MQTCDTLVHIRHNRTLNPDDSIRIVTNEFRHNLLCTEKQLVSKLIDKLQNKKVTEISDLNVFVEVTGDNANFFIEDLQLMNF